MTMNYMYKRASGTGLGDFHWLAFRFEGEDYRPESGESWVGLREGKTMKALFWLNSWITGLCRTESKVWVTQAAGQVVRVESHRPRERRQTEMSLGGFLGGVWGLRDDFVFAWGTRQGSPMAFHFDGTEWREAGTEGDIMAVHGVRDDLVIAVGINGYIGRWDGRDFQTMQGASRGNLSSVFVVSDEEIYAVGTDGDVLEGTVHGWQQVLRHVDMLHCVAKWNDAVWIGGPSGWGLMQLQNGELVQIKDNIPTTHLEAGESLLISGPEMIAETKNGAKFMASKLKNFVDLVEDKPISWY